MFEIQAENRDPTDRDINQPKETHKRGCYLALTFGTLLSSQGTDAHRHGPCGLRRWRRSYPTPRPSSPPEGNPPAGLPARAAHREPYTIREGRAQGVLRPPGEVAQSPRRLSIPTVRPGCPAISRTASRTPGMNEARS